MSLEILAPAGNPDSFFAAVNAGANAIYLGLKEFSARKSAENFSVENLGFYLRFAHFFGIKVYVAVNTLVKDDELDDFLNVITRAYALGADAFIVQDIFLGKKIKEKIPGICLHLSTQAGTCNELGAALAAKCSFSRVILARETAFEDIEKIAKIIETEVFVHGAMCTCFSGHCYMSSFAGGFSGNRGFCKQPCRKKYTAKGEGFDSFTGYALSLSDLCLADHIKRYAEIGVTSFKIEGRMRSPEYVYSAVSVYKEAMFSGGYSAENFKRLKRSFNRGDFTSAYFKPFTRDIISSKIQGNIGDFIGNACEVGNESFLVESQETFSDKDGFKVLRNGLEVGGAAFIRREKRYLRFSSSAPVKVGDEIRITRDSAFAEWVSKLKRKEKVSVKLLFEEDKAARATLSCGNYSLEVVSDDIFPTAIKRGLTETDVMECFSKVDDHPFEPSVEVEIRGNIFAAKSVLNAFRRKCYGEFFLGATEIKTVGISEKITFERIVTSNVKDSKIAVISSDFAFDLSRVDIVVFKPFDYSSKDEFDGFFRSTDGKEMYLYVPPFSSGKDLEIIEKAAVPFDGIYAEGYFGAILAKSLGKKLFCGTGFNIFNGATLSEVSSFADEYCYSKELSSAEIRKTGGNGFTLSLGCVQVMDLIYCPFSFDCANCGRGNVFTLTDEAGRKFTVRRYRLSSCRFEVYNPYGLIAARQPEGNKLYDFTLYSAFGADALMKAESTAEYKNVITEYTSGNTVRGIE